MRDDVVRVINHRKRERDFYAVAIARRPKSNKAAFVAARYGHFHAARFNHCADRDLVHVGDFGACVFRVVHERTIARRSLGCKYNLQSNPRQIGHGGQIPCNK